MEFISRSVEQTRRVGMRLGALLKPGYVICLAGDLGSGKTTLVQGIAAGWGSLDQVSSPTFVLVNVYKREERHTPLTGAAVTGKTQSKTKEEHLYHLDAYRLSGPEEAEALDLDAMLEDGPLVVEWADRIKSALPQDRLWIVMRYIDTNQRDLVITGYGARYQSMLAVFRQRVFGVRS
jgi:tRNA threonylcarbamoyladenosine biosynthesis protein TsaE